MARCRNADVVTNSQKPHGQELDGVVLVEGGQIRDKSYRKELISAELRIGGLSAAASEERFDISSS